MKMLNFRIVVFQLKIMELENINSYLIFFFQIFLLLAIFFLVQLISDSSSNSEGISCNFNEILNSFLEFINRKRVVVNCCKEVIIDLQGVCEKYYEILVCGWSYSFIYGS